MINIPTFRHGLAASGVLLAALLVLPAAASAQTAELRGSVDRLHRQRAAGRDRHHRQQRHRRASASSLPTSRAPSGRRRCSRALHGGVDASPVSARTRRRWCSPSARSPTSRCRCRWAPFRRACRWSAAARGRDRDDQVRPFGGREPGTVVGAAGAQPRLRRPGAVAARRRPGPNRRRPLRHLHVVRRHQRAQHVLDADRRRHHGPPDLRLRHREREPGCGAGVPRAAQSVRRGVLARRHGGGQRGDPLGHQRPVRAGCPTSAATTR